MFKTILVTAALAAMTLSSVALADNPHIKPVHDERGRLVGYVDTSPAAIQADATFFNCIQTDPRPYPRCFTKPDGDGGES